MKKVLDLKAIGWGLVAFVIAYLFITQVLSRLVTPEMYRWMVGHAAWLSWVNEIFPTAIAGFVSAWTARSHRIVNGVIGGLLPVILFVVWFVSFILEFQSWLDPLVVMAFFGSMAFLGGVLGSYLRGKRGD